MAGTRMDGRVERGNQTRRAVLARTMDIASAEGLQGLSLGRIATELELSKSGVFALFGSKEELQLATIRAASAVFARQVVLPAQELPPGVGRLARLCAGKLAYSRDRVFTGGCFFTRVSAEFAARTGPVRDAVAAAHRDWHDHVRRTAEEARTAGELAAGTDVAGLAFELRALLDTADIDAVLLGGEEPYEQAAAAVLARLRGAAVDPGSVPQTLAG